MRTDAERAYNIYPEDTLFEAGDKYAANRLITEGWELVTVSTRSQPSEMLRGGHYVTVSHPVYILRRPTPTPKNGDSPTDSQEGEG